jgi:hypothetical protein
MGAVSASKRVEALRALGVSEPLIQLSCGEELHRLFSVSYKGPPWYVYHGSIGVPKGPPFVPLWEFAEVATGVRRQADGPEFIKYSFGRPREYTVLARTEQGFWATAFDFLWEGGASDEELRAAAGVVGFRYLDRLLLAREQAELDTFELHQAYLRGLVAGIDAEARPAAPGPAPDRRGT